MGWREEIVTALDEWIAVEGGAGGKPRWRRLGRAIRTGDGLYVVDVRGAELSPDRFDGLRLAGAEPDSLDEGFAVMDVSQSESTLTVRVAEFADPADSHLWSLLRHLGELEVALAGFDVAGCARDQVFLRAPQHHAKGSSTRYVLWSTPSWP
ncbi:hypothetical protein ACFQ0B_12480 [Nonomuraea thailandensis]